MTAGASGTRVRGCIFFTKNGRVMGRPARTEDGDEDEDENDGWRTPVEKLTDMVFAFQVGVGLEYSHICQMMMIF